MQHMKKHFLKKKKQQRKQATENNLSEIFLVTQWHYGASSTLL